MNYRNTRFCEVATREGGVDRNGTHSFRENRNCRSPPARVAWIETKMGLGIVFTLNVATREGGVDRNV